MKRRLRAIRHRVLSRTWPAWTEDDEAAFVRQMVEWGDADVLLHSDIRRDTDGRPRSWTREPQ